MRRFAVLLVTLALAAPVGARAADEQLTDYVDPFIGTLGAGFVFPGPAAPYGMVQLSPDTEGYFAYTGYQYADKYIRGFSHVHTQSMGVPEGGQIPFMPISGPIVTGARAYQQPFSHALEHAEPGYYEVTLGNGVRAELTAGQRVGLHRYAFPRDVAASVIIDAGRFVGDGDPDQNLDRPLGYGQSEVHISGDTVTGSVLGGDYPVHFAARFNKPFASSGVWDSPGGTSRAGSDAAGNGAGAVVSFELDPYEAPNVTAEVGISFVSPANALGNLDAEMSGRHFDFDGVRAQTRAAWEDALHAIVVQGGSEDQKKSFYTALYHAQHHPNVFNDVNGEYRGYDNAVHNIADAPMNGRPYYANYSFWDTYRAEMPLLMMIAPDRVPDMMRSLAAIVQQGGRLPRWGWMSRYADFMNGEPGVQVFADAYCRELVPADVLDTLWGSARDLTLVNRRNGDYLSKGFVAGDASATLEHASADFALALVANERGAVADRDTLLDQAGNWQNHVDPESQFLRPRNADGTWFTNAPDGRYHPELPDRWREGTGWQYSWLVSHDARALIEAMGPATAEQRLDTFFAGATAPYVGPEAQQKASAYGIAYYGNQYAPSNEHDLQAPWVYNWTGSPWKTQALQRSLQTIYRATPDGLPGNDDLGTMSAWFIWSALGFYPMTPGSPTLTIGSPLFTEASIRLPGGAFTVRAPDTSLPNRFISKQTLNGGDLPTTWFDAASITPGGSIEFEMGAAPNVLTPPTISLSQSTDALAEFGCSP